MSKRDFDVQFDVAGERLRELRTGSGREAQQVAKVLGISISGLGAIERGKSNPSLYVLIRAARYFGVPLTYLAGDGVEGLAS